LCPKSNRKKKDKNKEVDYFYTDILGQEELTIDFFYSIISTYRRTYYTVGVNVMRAIKPMELRDNQKEMLDLAYNGEILLVARPAKKNVVVLSEYEFNRREKALRNAEYLAKLDKSIEQAKNGELVSYTREQMKAMEE